MYSVTPIEPFGVQLNAVVRPPISELLTLLDRHSIVLVRDLQPMDESTFLQYCQTADSNKDPVLHWSFGPVMQLKVDPSKGNYLFSNEGVPLHWDGAFFEVPSVLVFNCVKAPSPSTGGETVFTHTPKVLEQIPPVTRKWMQNLTITYETEKLAHYGGKVSVPLISEHPKQKFPILRYAEPVPTESNPVSVTVDGIPTKNGEELMRKLSEICYRPENCVVHTWKSGDLLLADNHTVIHGRRAYATSPNCQNRHLQRIQLK